MNKKHKLAIALCLLLLLVFIYYQMQPKPSPKTPELAAVAQTDRVSASSPAPAKSALKTQASVKANLKPWTKAAPQAAVEESPPPVLDNANYFLGSWCNKEAWKDKGEFFSLLILLSEEGETSAIFSNGGPFSETLQMNISGIEAEFYFDSLGGSIAFNDIANQSEAKDCSEKVASGKLIDENSLEIAHINDVCGHMSAPTESLVLTRLNEGETCLAEDSIEPE